MTTDLFDRNLRSLRRDRAARSGPDLFLLDRAFDDCLDRIADIARSFDRAMLIGCPSPSWPDRLGSLARTVEALDPGALFALRAGGAAIEEDRFDYGSDRYDLVVAIGTLDTVNDLPVALRLISRSMKPDAPLIGAIAGGNSLPSLRASLIEAGRKEGVVRARTHPRIEPASLTQLLVAAGFNMPVVDVDRVSLRYKDVDHLIRDLRAMASTSVLARRPPPMSKAEYKNMRHAFAAQLVDGRTEEIVEILHFLGWTQ